MNFFNIFNKASQTITDYFSFFEKKIQNPQKQIQDSLIQINQKIFIWIKDTNFKDDEFIHVIHTNFKDNYLIYNLLPDKVVFCVPFVPATPIDVGLGFEL